MVYRHASRDCPVSLCNPGASLYNPGGSLLRRAQVGLIVLLGFCAAPTMGQGYAESCTAGLCTQTFTLSAGWNAVWLEVQPEPDDSETVLQGLPLDSAWSWDPQLGRVEYVQNPTEPRLKASNFLGYFPPDRPESFVNNLQRIKSNRPYLLKLTSAASWSVTGRPAVRPPRWAPDSFNLVGMPVDNTAPISFASYFAQSPAHAGSAIRRLDPSGTWQTIPASSTMRPGEAFWIETNGGSSYAGPLSVTVPMNDGLDFGETIDKLQLRIDNRRTTPQATRIEVDASALGRLSYRHEKPSDPTRSEWPLLPPLYQ
ncbi:MAG: hypothetical protein K8J08_22750, partial [Thermoanaerobaculia bacterium]|nr:hypothetical protein [Thermoanaerobaculia bacterium]